MTDTAGGGEVGLAKGTGDTGATVNLGVEVLQADLLALNALQKGYTADNNYHLQVILTLEYPVTGFTVVPVMSQRLHMLIHCILRVEFPGASLAFEAWWWCPVIQAVHMLVARSPRPKRFVASFASSLVAIVDHVAFVLIFVKGREFTLRTLVHFREMRSQCWGLANEVP